MVALLWSSRLFTAAIRLEEFWNQLLRSADFQLFCAYPLTVLDQESHPDNMNGVLSNHTRVLPTGTNGAMQDAIVRAVNEVFGLKADQLKIPAKFGRLNTASKDLPQAEATILWLRESLPDYADDVLARARHYYRASLLAQGS
jgi:hypothetical protein